MTKVTIRYTDDSISVIDVPMPNEDDEENLTVSSQDDYFTLDDENDNSVGWIVKENVKYIIVGELINNIRDTKSEGDSQSRTHH